MKVAARESRHFFSVRIALYHIHACSAINNDLPYLWRLTFPPWF